MSKINFTNNTAVLDIGGVNNSIINIPEMKANRIVLNDASLKGKLMILDQIVPNDASLDIICNEGQSMIVNQDKEASTPEFQISRLNELHVTENSKIKINNSSNNNIDLIDIKSSIVSYDTTSASNVEKLIIDNNSAFHNLAIQLAPFKNVQMEKGAIFTHITPDKLTKVTIVATRDNDIIDFGEKLIKLETELENIKDATDHPNLSSNEASYFNRLPYDLQEMILSISQEALGIHISYDSVDQL